MSLFEDVPHDVYGLNKVPEEVPADGEGGGAVGLYADAYVLHAEQVRLQPRFYDIERACDDRTAHTPKPAHSCESILATFRQMRVRWMLRLLTRQRRSGAMLCLAARIL